MNFVLLDSTLFKSSGFSPTKILDLSFATSFSPSKVVSAFNQVNEFPILSLSVLVER